MHAYMGVASANDLGIDVKSVEQSTSKPTRGFRLGRPEAQRQPGGAARHRVGPDQQTDGGTPLDDSLHPEPRCKREPAERRRWRFGDVKDDEAELAGLQHERKRAERLFERALI